MNTSPLIIYTVYFDENVHSHTPAAIIEGQVRGYFHGKVTRVKLPRSFFTHNFSVRRRSSYFFPTHSMIFPILKRSFLSSGTLKYLLHLCVLLQNVVLSYCYKHTLILPLACSILRARSLPLFKQFVITFTFLITSHIIVHRSWNTSLLHCDFTTSQMLSCY